MVREAVRDLGEEALQELIVGVVRGVDRAESAVGCRVPGYRFTHMHIKKGKQFPFSQNIKKGAGGFPFSVITTTGIPMISDSKI